MGVDEKALGQRLARARRQAGLTQQELCQKAGLSYSTLAKIERGAIRSPSVFTVASIAAATSASIETLLDIKKPGSPALPDKKTSKSGVRFVYFDIGGVLIRFYHRAFTEVADEAGVAVDVVETLFWRHNDAACRGQMSMEELNTVLAKELGIEGFDWQDYFLKAVEPMPGIDELVTWASEHYEVGLLSNIMPGFLDSLKSRKFIPNVDYTAVVDSSKVGAVKPEQMIYTTAQKMSGAQAKEILLIDDSRTNLTAADRLGWRVLWFDGYHPEESIQKARESLEF